MHYNANQVFSRTRDEAVWAGVPGSILKCLLLSGIEMKHIRSICVFCASSNAVGEVYLDAATDLGRRMGLAGIDLVYGGASIGLLNA